MTRRVIGLLPSLNADASEISKHRASDSKTAAVERKQAYADAAKGGYLVAGAHLSFPGIGRIRAEGKGYAWVPVNYSGLK